MKTKLMNRMLYALVISAMLASMLVGCAVPTATEPPAQDTTSSPTQGPEEAEPTEASPAQKPPETVIYGMAQSKLGRVVAPDVSADDEGELVSGNNAFAWDFYQAVRDQEGNLFFSPYSISLALAMTYAGAEGETEAQMADTLHFNIPFNRLHAAFNALDQQLASRGQVPEGQEGQPFQLSIANSIWAQYDYDFTDSYLDLLAENYGAGLNLVDFVTATEAARLAINDWVSEQTKGKIEDLIPAGAIDVMTRLVLANAIYFKADWQFPFEPEATREGDFYRLDGSQVQVEMMNMSHPPQLPYTQGNGYQAVAMPYLGGDLSMVVVVPDAGKYEEFESGLSAEVIDAILASMEGKSVQLVMPKFNFSSEFSLAQTLAGMGMADAFDPTLADFSGMIGRPELYIQNVLHKAFVAVDEKGTEAAAATAVIVGITSMPMIDVELTVDRPFVFLIQDNASSTVLFIGRVVDPSS
jgi:serpin B